MGILRFNQFLISIKGKEFISFLFLFLLSSSALAAGPSVKAKLEKKYPKCQIELKSVFPDADKLAVAKKRFPTKRVENFYSYYIKTCSGKKSLLFVFSDIIRTQKQFLLFDVNNKKIEDIQLLKFLEPNEYKVSSRWLKVLKKDQEVDTVSGATLTSKSSKFLAWLALYLEGIITANG